MLLATKYHCSVILNLMSTKFYFFHLQPDEIFVQTLDGDDISTPPPAKKLKKSQCTPLFMNAYKLRSKKL